MPRQTFRGHMDVHEHIEAQLDDEDFLFRISEGAARKSRAVRPRQSLHHAIELALQKPMQEYISHTLLGRLYYLGAGSLVEKEPDESLPFILAHSSTEYSTVERSLCACSRRHVTLLTAPVRWLCLVRVCARCQMVQEAESDTVLHKFQKCDGCRSVYYCSLACQAAHWRTHRTACRAATPTRLTNEAIDDRILTYVGNYHQVPDGCPGTPGSIWHDFATVGESPPRLPPVFPLEATSP